MGGQGQCFEFVDDFLSELEFDVVDETLVVGEGVVELLFVEVLFVHLESNLNGLLLFDLLLLDHFVSFCICIIIRCDIKRDGLVIGLIIKKNFGYYIFRFKYEDLLD